VDIDPERQRLIGELFEHLEDLDHYSLLGVFPQDDRKAVKDAYYRVVGIFHPDKYFGKRLGPFKEMLEAIFARLTDAQDVLGRRQRRELYDQQLKVRFAAAGRPWGTHLEVPILTKLRRVASAEAAGAKTPDVSAEPAPSSPPQARPAEITGVRAPKAPPLPSDLVSRELGRPSVPAPPIEPVISEVPPPPVSTGRAAVPPVSSSAPPSTPSQRPMGMADRRQALARKLRPSQPPNHPPETAGVVLPKEEAAAHVRRAFDERMAAVDKTREAQVKKHLDSAEAAERAGDATGCANSLRFALSLDPDNPSIREKLVVADRRAAAAMADTYLGQARLAEQNGQMADAARAYGRAALGKSSAHLYLKAAECLLVLGADLRTAAELAKKGLELAPKDASLHLALGRAFLGAGMRSSAEREINLASQLAPEDDTIRDWLKRLKRREV